MSKYSALIKRASNATAALALTVASLTPAMMLGGSAKAAQITARSVAMSDSEQDATGVGYTATFTTPGSVTSVVISFCSNSPLPDDDCTAPTGMSVSSATVSSGWTKTGATANTITANLDTPASGAQSLVISGVSNPTSVMSFYARIQTWDATAGSGNRVDFGGAAMYTTDDLVINARVQEQLTFCVGSDTATNISNRTNCDTISDQTVDLGIVGSGLTTSPVLTGGTTSGNNKTGFFVLSTNATNGASIKFFGRTQLKVSGALCDGDSIVDQCFNNSDGSGLVQAGTEGFGMYIDSITRKGNATGMGTELVRDSNYSDEESNDKWTTSLDEIATGDDPVDWDLGVIKFNATTSTPTPSGYYTTQANFIATGLF